MSTDLRVIDQLGRIEAMLKSLLRSSNSIHYVGGYAHGRTKKGDPFLVLYPEYNGLKFQICRVYEHGFKRLPLYVNTTVPESAPEELGDKDSVDLFECRPFCILTFDGKDTNMGREKRFSDLLYVLPERKLAPEHVLIGDSSVPVKIGAWIMLKGRTGPQKALLVAYDKVRGMVSAEVNGTVYEVDESRFITGPLFDVVTKEA